MTVLNLEEAALEAARGVSAAAAELIRWAREGTAFPNVAFDGTVVEDLAKALRTSIDIEGSPIFDHDTQPAEFEREARLLAALSHALDAYLGEADPGEVRS